MKTKSIFAFVLALVLAMSLSVTAFAAAGNEKIKLGDKSFDVEGSYSGDTAVTAVYSVDVKWGEMVCTYKTSGDKTWNPVDHTYSVDEGDGWDYKGNDVVVTNHSNVPVNVAFSFAKDDAADRGTYQGKMSVENEQLAAGLENHPEMAATVTSLLTFTGKLNVVETTQDKLGTITVTVSAVTVEP